MQGSEQKKPYFATDIMLITDKESEHDFYASLLFQTPQHYETDLPTLSNKINDTTFLNNPEYLTKPFFEDQILQTSLKLQNYFFVEPHFPAITHQIKTCSCKRSKCVKGYCECFNQGNVCNKDCGCINCLNTEIADKNGLKKYQGCNCKKSLCIKNYCGCFNSGKGCGKQCKCLNCRNEKKY